MPKGSPPFWSRLPATCAVCLRRVSVLLLSLLLVAGARAELTLNRYISVNQTVAMDSSYESSLVWNNNGFTNISSVSVTMNVSGTNNFVVGGTSATLNYNLLDTNEVTETIYPFDELDGEPALDATFLMTGPFTSPGINNDWDVILFNDFPPFQDGEAQFNYWRLIVTGGAVTNGTIEVGAQGITSASSGYTVNGAAISAGTGTGTNGVTVTNSESLTFNGGLTGSGDLNKVGSGTLFVGGNSTGFTGVFRLNEGTANFISNNALGSGVLVQSNASSTAIFSAGGTYNENMSLFNVSFTNGGNTLSGTITNNGTTYNVATGTTNTLSGFQTGSGGITLTGGGTLAVTGTTNDYTGNTVISNGTLRITTLANSNTVSSVGRSNNITLAGTALSTNANSATTAVIDYTGGNVATDRTFVLTNGGGAINMATAATEMTLTGSASGAGKLIVSEGTLILSNGTTPNSFAPGSIQLDSGSTLRLVTDQQIGDSTGLVLNGGTLLFGNASVTENLGTLTLTADSTIDLGNFGATGLRQLNFANSAGVTWATNAILTITNWQGVLNASSDHTEIFFGIGGLTSAQQAQIRFANQGNAPGGLLGTGELVPVPEPKIYVAALALLGVVGWRERRRIALILGLKRGS